MKVRWVLLSILLGLSALSVGLLFVYGSHRRHIEEAVGTKATQVEEKIVANDTIRHDESAKGSEENKGKVKKTEAVHEADGVRKESALSSDWVDLGLPSGTLWKRNNENGYFTNDEAKRLYRKKLPSIDQFTELVKHCRAVWSDGWFRWEKKGRYIHEYATMDIADVPIFREYKVKRLNKDSFVYFEPEYRKFIYRFARVEE